MRKRNNQVLQFFQTTRTNGAPKENYRIKIFMVPVADMMSKVSSKVKFK